MVSGRGRRVLLLLAAAAIPACAHHVRESNVTATDGDYRVPLTGTTWRVEMLGADAPLIPAAAKTALRIDRDGRVTGNTGCNRFSGRANIDGSAMTFDLIALTHRECEPPVMETEKAIVTALETTRTWAMDGKYLGLLDERGHYVMKLVRAKGRIESGS
jgi:heat shock protein HslJ